MNCEQVKTILEDYLDGKINKEEKSAVDAHCRECAACREELAFLKKYRKAIRNFPTLRAPDDFLKKVHSGIDRQQRGGIVRTLFFPLRVKVPLEAAALLALAVTGVLIFKPYQTGTLEYGAERPPAVTEEKTTAASSGKHDIALNSKQALPEKKAASAPERKREPRPVYEQEEAAVTVGSAPEAAKKEKHAESLDMTEITLSLRQNTAPEDEFVRDRAGSTEDARVETGQSSLRSNAVSGSSRAKKAEQKTPDRGGISAIDGLARTLGGKIIKKAADDTTGAIRFVVVELPAGNFNQFIGGLGARWSVLGQVPAGPPPGTGTVRINMHIQN